MGQTRPKGYMEWKPQAHVLEVVRAVRQVLNEYSHYGPMTVRQIFYRLVGQHGYDKTEHAYRRLAEYLVKARRSGRIDFASIRDDGTTTLHKPGNTTRQDIWDDMIGFVGDPANYYSLDRQLEQPQHIELWCEAAGMAPMLARMVRDLNIPVYSTGGFSSVTVTYEVSQRVAARDKPTYFLHVGDYDPSGESIFASMSQDIGSFVAADVGGLFYTHTGRVKQHADDEPGFFIPQRVALTEDQVEEFDLPTAPAKITDSRSRNWVGETTQAEAMPPDLLERVVLDHIAGIMDQDKLTEIEERDRDDRVRLDAAVKQDSVTDIIAERELLDPSVLEVVEAIAERDMEDES